MEWWLLPPLHKAFVCISNSKRLQNRIAKNSRHMPASFAV